MKKHFIAVVIVGAIVAAAFILLSRAPEVEVEVEVEPVATDFPEPPAGAVVFDMKYLGLSGEKDELRYNSYWGFGQSGRGDTAFINDVKKKTEGIETARNPYFTGAEWAAVEIKDKKPMAFYFDLDADGKLSDNENILPIQTEDSASFRRTEFVTPDFIMNTRDGNQVPFRAMFQVAFDGDGPSSRPHFRWSPSCVLEGTSTIAGEPAKLILFTNGFSGSFKDFGRSSLSLQVSKEKTGSNLPKQMLSSIINHNEQFYNIEFNGRHGKNSTVRAILTEYTGDTGNLTTQLTGNTNLQAKLSSASVAGSKDTTVQFNLASEQAKLPTGAYKLSSGNVNYSTENGDKWRLDFKEGPEFTIDADKTCKVELGKPVLSISAVEESKRYRNDVKEETVYSEGTEIYISRIIKGKGGELYGRFSQKQEDSPRHIDIEPEIRIADSEGKEVAAAKIKYG